MKDDEAEELVSEIRRKKRLLDIEILAALGDGGLDPSDEDLDYAPRLNMWLFGSRLGVPCLCGHVVNHVVVDDGKISTTRPIHADVHRGWVRTENTLYKLGRHQ